MSYTIEITIPASPAWEIAVDCSNGHIVSQSGQPEVTVDALRSLLSQIANLHNLTHAHGWTEIKLVDSP